MLSSPAAPPATQAGSHSVVTSALRKAGLMDRDTRMRDLTDKPGGRKSQVKSTHKARSGRPRPLDSVLGKTMPSSSRNPMGAARIPADSFSIRGAAKGVISRSRRGPPILSDRQGTGMPPGRPVRNRIISSWKEVIESRYNPETRFLNLERLAGDESLAQKGLKPFTEDSANPKEASVVWKLAGALEPKPQTISLAHNKMTSGAALHVLAYYLPDLVNLSLEGNQLTQWRELDSIQGRKNKLNNLRELILIGNPIRELEIKNNRAESYRSEITRRFPSLQMLDQEPITTISFNADMPEASTSTATPSVNTTPQSFFTKEMGPSFITGIDSSVVNEFLTRYLPLFDTQRGALLDVYHPSATFSFSVNTTIPTRARIEGFHSSPSMPNQRKLEWGAWLQGGLGGSRNLSRLAGGLEKMTKTLHIGSVQIIEAMTNLPATRHEITSSPDRFCVDAWPIPHGEGMGLFVTLHGQFTEMPVEGIRSFDRSFILAPAPDDSRAKANGWSVIILSDQLNVRSYSSNEAWRPGYMRVQHGENIPTQPMSAWVESINPQARAQLEAVQAFPEPERTWVLQICQRTGLNVQFAVDCLQNNEWNLERAVKKFEEVKGTLTREAFL